MSMMSKQKIFSTCFKTFLTKKKNEIENGFEQKTNSTEEDGKDSDQFQFKRRRKSYS
jgi:hypothetical protein